MNKLGANSPVNRVGLAIDPLVSYDAQPPFSPPRAFSELPEELTGHLSEGNAVYSLVRDAMANAGLDSEHFGTALWNPMGDIVAPGKTVVILPNGVNHYNCNPQGGLFSVITHGSVIRAVVDYVLLAVGTAGRIVIAHAPLNSADFETWMTLSGCRAILQYYRNTVKFKLECLDLRAEFIGWNGELSYSPYDQRTSLAGDPAGYVDFDLGRASAFEPWGKAEQKLLYGADYDRAETVRAHSMGRHVYRVAKTVLGADCVVAVPKLKTHMKVGVTVNLKGMVGTQGYKNFVPHFRVGPPRHGGDEYPDCGAVQEVLHNYRRWIVERCLNRQNQVGDMQFKFHKRVLQMLQGVWDAMLRAKYPGYQGRFSGGSWCGNDTAWRMAIDLTRIVLFGAADGVLGGRPARTFVSVVDGVIAGEGDGPLSPAARQVGTIVCGINPVAVDVVCAHLMGFDALRIPMLKAALSDINLSRWEGGAAGIQVSRCPDVCVPLKKLLKGQVFGFAAPRGWSNVIVRK